MGYDENVAVTAVDKVVKGGDRAAMALTTNEVTNLVWLILHLTNRVADMDPYLKGETDAGVL
jgi:hypothetical protein